MKTENTALHDDKIDALKQSPKKNDLESAYCLTATTKFVDGIGYVNTYGIGSCNNKDPKKVCIIDVSTDRSFVENIIRMLNDNGVSYEHFYDVVEDIVP